MFPACVPVRGRRQEMTSLTHSWQYWMAMLARRWQATCCKKSRYRAEARVVPDGTSALLWSRTLPNPSTNMNGWHFTKD